MDSIGEPRRRPPLWQFVPRIVEGIVLGIILLAATVDIITLAASSTPWPGYAAPIVLVVGVAAGYRLPWAGLAVVAVAPMLAVAAGAVPVATWSMVCFAAFLFTLRGMRGLVVGGLLAVVNFASAAFSIGTIDISVDASASIFGFAALVGAAFGSALFGNVRYRREVEARIRETEAARIAAVDRGIAQERLRIARDLHDSVGHQIAVVNMHLGAAEVSLGPGETRARGSLDAARGAVQEVLRETQQILAILRVGRDEDRMEATPGHELIRHLIDSYRTAGMTIEENVQELGDGIVSQVSIAAYRIVQEALTNAHRYGDGTASVTVLRDHDEDAVRIEIANMQGARRRPSSPGGGNGLVGMRERAESVGGRMDVQHDDPLFWVTAVLPVTGEA